VQDEDQLHRAARGADEELAHGLVVEYVEIDLGQDDRRCRLALEAVDRFDEEVALAIHRLSEEVVVAGEVAQTGLAQAVERQEP
jgi:hypothetical protein